MTGLNSRLPVLEWRRGGMTALVFCVLGRGLDLPFLLAVTLGLAAGFETVARKLENEGEGDDEGRETGEDAVEREAPHPVAPPVATCEAAPEGPRLPPVIPLGKLDLRVLSGLRTVPPAPEPPPPAEDAADSGSDPERLEPVVRAVARQAETGLASAAALGTGSGATPEIFATIPALESRPEEELFPVSVPTYESGGKKATPLVVHEPVAEPVGTSKPDPVDPDVLPEPSRLRVL